MVDGKNNFLKREKIILMKLIIFNCKMYLITNSIVFYLTSQVILYYLIISINVNYGCEMQTLLFSVITEAKLFVSSIIHIFTNK